jgi:AcrR family transcriptional regulator
MTRKSPAPPTVKTSDAYHHGDLRSALIAAAREALETMAPEQVTLKSLAMRLGVSQPAPYRHFSNREALLAAVAAEGFERFRARLLEAEAAAAPGANFEAACLAYLRFGRENKGVYRLMFASNIGAATHDDALLKAGAAAFDILLDGVRQKVDPALAPTVAIWIWSTLHGLVMLEADGMSAGPVGGVTPEAVVRQMTRSLQPSV